MRLIKIRHSAAGIQRLSLAVLEQVSNGEIDVVDPTNLFYFIKLVPLIRQRP